MNRTTVLKTAAVLGVAVVQPSHLAVGVTSLLGVLLVVAATPHPARSARESRVWVVVGSTRRTRSVRTGNPAARPR